MLHDDDVLKIFNIDKQIGRESHSFLEFVRFEELANSVLVSRIEPKSNIIPLISEHFADRLHCENWIILDTGRNFAAIHEASKPVFFSYLTESELANFSVLSDTEKGFQNLWKTFFDTIAIKERCNPKLQQSNMPLRYRKYMKAENNRGHV